MSFPKAFIDYTNSATGTSSVGTTVHPWLLRHKATSPQSTKFTDDLETVSPVYATPSSAKEVWFGGGVNTAPPVEYLYAAAWQGTAAELTDTQAATLLGLVKNGTGVLNSVTIGGQLAQQYTYSGGLLTAIKDGAGNQVAAFSYASATAGQIDRVATSRGTVGFEYNTSRTGCTAGNTILYFNQGNTSSCSIDSDCGSGYLCGGKTGTGSTGKCFLAARCMTLATTNGESVITNISPLGPGGGACTGACTDVMQYVWTQGVGKNPNGLINVAGTEDATSLGNYVSIQYNNNGLPHMIGYGDTDADPTTGGYARVDYRYYDTTYPGRISEIRRLSDLGTGACSDTDTTNCDRTVYGYDPTSQQLTSVLRIGFTLNSSGAATSFTDSYTTSYDSLGRITETDTLDVAGLPMVKATYDYYAVTGSLQDSFLQDSKTYKDASNSLVTTILGYDFWGHATGASAPDANLTCDTYDAARGFLASRRHAMAGQSNCTTMNAADITTQWARDSWLRLTQLTHPDGACVLYTYDSSGRPYQIKRRDDCSASSSGDTQQYTYTADSQVLELDTYDSTGALTAKQPYAYYDSRRVQEIVNPVDTSKFTGLVYDDGGKVIEVDGASSLSKIVYHYTGSSGRDHRITSEERYKTSSTSDTWSLLYAWMGEQSQVTDGDSKVTGSTRDDASRLVKLSSPDFANPTIHVYDLAGRLTTVIEDLGGTLQQTHNFTFDYMSRPLNDDYQGSCTTTGTPHPEIQRTYDALPSGVTCPMTGGCNNLAGRLAYVETILMCSSAYASTDGSLDQFTFYSYDAAGRVVEEYITDDTGRVADQKYQYTKDGDLTQVTLPSGTAINWTYGSTSNNSDTDLVTGISRGSGVIADTIQWFPFGPLKQYNWEASVMDGTLQYLATWIHRNLAYRITVVYNGEEQSGSTGVNSVTITEDAMGRVTSRVYNPHNPT